MGSDRAGQCSLVGTPVGSNCMSRRKEINFDLDQLVGPHADLCIVRLTDVGLPARNKLFRQSSEGMVCGYGEDRGRW